jgi:Gluconate 2-dehydrogenase subunit 3
MSPTEPRLSRREALQWVIAAGAAISLPSFPAFAEEAAPVTGKPYGTDPVLNRTYKAGDLWPLTLAAGQRRTVTALSDLILPADDHSPAASAVGVPDFIDEWISAPYATQAKDRKTVLDGLKWLEAESDRRFRKPFAELSVEQQANIADDIAWLPRAKPEHEAGAKFFATFRNLVTSGFYTTPVGMKDIGFTGNVALTRFPDAPKEALEKLGLA